MSITKTLYRTAFWFISAITSLTCYAQQNLPPEYQEKIKQAQAKLDSLKKTDPNLKNVQIPDIAKQMQETIDKANAGMTKANSSLKQSQAVVHQSVTMGLPVKNSSGNTDKLKKPAGSIIIALATAKLQEASANLSLDPFLIKQLDKMSLDTNVNLAGTGVLLLLNGMPKWPAEYLICKAVLKPNPDQWAINDLGIVFRDDNKNMEALECFFYAEQMDDQSIVIKTNIGWASAYYGDFPTAKKYFNTALTMDENYSSALEGLALIAYQEGNTAALFQALAKQITGLAGGGGSGDGDGPSQAFAGFCGGIQMDQQMQNAGKQSQDNPNDNHTYDSKAPDDDGGQDPPPTADAVPPNYPDAKPIFITQLQDLIYVGGQVSKFHNLLIQENQKWPAQLKQKLQSLPSLRPTPTIDDQDIVIQNSYAKYYSLFNGVHLLFVQRVKWITAKLKAEMDPYLAQIPIRDMDLLNGYTAALGSCHNPDPIQAKKCVDQINCAWIPRLRGAKNSDVEGAARIWNKYFDQLVDNIHWYTQSSDPFIKRVHQTGWNEYMNMLREWDVRRAVLDLYSDWGDAIMGVNFNGSIAAYGSQPVPSCPVTMGSMGDGADPYAKKIGKLKTFVECHIPPFSYKMLGQSWSGDCKSTRISLKAGPLGGFIQHDNNLQHSEKDTYTTGISVSVGIPTPKGSVDLGPAKFSAGINASADVTVSAQYNANTGQRIKTDVDIDLTVGASAGANLNISNDDKDPLSGSATGSLNGAVGSQVSAELGVHVQLEAIAGPNGELGEFGLSQATGQFSKKGF